MPNSGTTLAPVLLSGTSNEYLGRKPLARAIRQRPLLILAGPSGVGKSSVALRICGPGALRLGERALRGATVWRIRRGHWRDELLQTEALVLDGPVFLGRRPGVVEALRELVRVRVRAGLRTVVCEGRVRDGSIGLLMDAVAPQFRATVMLRFPVGRGRLRFARGMCDEFGLDLKHARATALMEPWSYEAVVAWLKRVHQEESAARG